MTDTESPPAPAGRGHFWLWVMCLLGLDYFSTLAYQPSITFEVAGRLGPLATAVVVLVTLGGTLPVYYYLAGRSPRGGGSIGMIERLITGWKGKTLMLILLGFAATDFTMLKTISLADAAQHLIRSDDTGWRLQLKEWTEHLHDLSEPLGPTISNLFNDQLTVTLILGLIGFLFWFLLRKGFNRNVLVLAVPLVGAYLILNGIILFGGIKFLAEHPDLVDTWFHQVHEGDWLIQPPFWAGTNWWSVGLLSLVLLPSLALGLSGFELSMIIMPQVRGVEGEEPPRTRVRNTRKVLVVAALIMTTYLLASSVVTTLLIPSSELTGDGKAVNRALAYLAHGGSLSVGSGPLLPWCGSVFGAVYDTVTVLILCLAGTSVMTALAVLLPHFLLRFGMEFQQAQRWGLLLIVFAAINFLVTVHFQADVASQRNAYASGVLVLMSSAALATVLDKRNLREAKKQERRGRWRRALGHFYYMGVAIVIALTTIAVAFHSGGGLLIAGGFVLALLAISVISRAYRADELRTLGFEFKNPEAKFLWDSLRMADFPVLVPHRPGHREREVKEEAIRHHHQLASTADIVFLEVEMDDPSNFYQTLLVDVFREDYRIVIKLTRCVSVAHAIAAVALEMSKESEPPGLHFGWSEMDLLTSSWSYFAFGEGNIPWKVRELINKAEPDPERRPDVIVG